MRLFMRRQTPDPPDALQPKECDHKWKDFDWYLSWQTINLDGSRLKLAYRIYEPYVCIHCGERKDVVLEDSSIIFKGGKRHDEAAEVIASLSKKYPKIKDRPIIEDQINDEQLVDREYLRIAEWLRGNAQSPRQGGSNALFK